MAEEPIRNQAATEETVGDKEGQEDHQENAVANNVETEARVDGHNHILPVQGPVIEHDQTYNDVVPLIMEEVAPAVHLKSDCESKSCTLKMIWSLLFSNLVMVLLVFIVPVFCQPGNKSSDTCYIDPFSVLIYAHTVYWIIHLVADQYLKHHHRTGRLLGKYFELI